ncbi:hypothetical protein CDAR_480481 [Caerostris darwini]|uniref:Uncharacterized protein n=1 Tax=Caerostris darwini TaxID=1538125 RepID=A0AAV4V0W6_9ARAC|nr:hypothetical protein CDAR_480481 [Caerostris darwini]
MSDGTFLESSANEIFKVSEPGSGTAVAPCRAEIKIPFSKGAERECWEFHNIVLTRISDSQTVMRYFLIPALPFNTVALRTTDLVQYSVSWYKPFVSYSDILGCLQFTAVNALNLISGSQTVTQYKHMFSYSVILLCLPFNTVTLRTTV